MLDRRPNHRLYEPLYSMSSRRKTAPSKVTEVEEDEEGADMIDRMEAPSTAADDRQRQLSRSPTGDDVDVTGDSHSPPDSKKRRISSTLTDNEVR